MIRALRSRRGGQRSRQRHSKARSVVNLTARVRGHDGRSSVRAIRRMTRTLLPFLINMSSASRICLSRPTFLGPNRHLLGIAIVRSPRANGVVRRTVEGRSRHRFVTLKDIRPRRTVSNVVRHEVSTGGRCHLVTVISGRLRRPLGTLLIFTLRRIMVRILLPRRLFCLFPTLNATPATAKAVRRSPLVFVRYRSSCLRLLAVSDAYSAFYSVNYETSVRLVMGPLHSVPQGRIV